MSLSTIQLTALLACLLFIGSTNASELSINELSTSQKREVIFDCQLLVNDYAIYRDQRNAKKLANLFTKDARMFARGKWNIGHNALINHVLQDDENTLSMHLMTTIQITPIDKNNAIGVSYAAIADEIKGDSPVISLHAFTVIGKYNDKYALTAQGWKISERIFTPIFARPELNEMNEIE